MALTLQWRCHVLNLSGFGLGIGQCVRRPPHLRNLHGENVGAVHVRLRRAVSYAMPLIVDD